MRRAVYGPIKTGVEVQRTLGGWAVVTMWNNELLDQVVVHADRTAANAFASEFYEDAYPGAYRLSGNAPYLKLAEAPRVS